MTEAQKPIFEVEQSSNLKKMGGNGNETDSKSRAHDCTQLEKKLRQGRINGVGRAVFVTPEWWTKAMKNDSKDRSVSKLKQKIKIHEIRLQSNTRHL